jgi:ABC-type sugar transport system ATPase subunit
MLKEDASVDKIIHMMVGRDLLSAVTREDRSVGKVRLVVKELSSPSFNNINFTIHEGEIVGFAGLVGSGRSNVARAIFGDEPYDRGEILLDGKPVRFRHPSDAINNGIGMIQEDRKELSLFMGLSIQFNMSVAKLPELSRGGIIKRAEVKQNSDNYIDQLSIKLNSVNDPVSSLSGGNQQKTTLARWLAIDPKLLIMDEPTHGVDVGAKADIYELMRDLAEQGISIMLISSELPEIMTMSDRVVVMHEGEVTAILEQAECDEETIMIYATGIGNNNK